MCGVRGPVRRLVPPDGAAAAIRPGPQVGLARQEQAGLEEPPAPEELHSFDLLERLEDGLRCSSSQAAARWIRLTLSPPPESHSQPIRLAVGAGRWIGGRISERLSYRLSGGLFLAFRFLSLRQALP